MFVGWDGGGGGSGFNRNPSMAGVDIYCNHTLAQGVLKSVQVISSMKLMYLFLTSHKFLHSSLSEMSTQPHTSLCI